MNTRLLALVGLLQMLAAGRATAQGAPSTPILKEQHSGTSARLQAVSAVSGPPPWSLLSSNEYWAVGASGDVAWAVGPGGRIVRIEARHRP